MNQLIALFSAVVLSFTLQIGDAEAKRLGGGKSSGLQRDNISQKQAAPQQAAPAAAKPAQAAPAAQPKRSWLGPIAGLAAGLGLAALFSHLGMGEEMANFFMILLLVMAAFFVFRLLFRRKTNAQAPLQYAGNGPQGGFNQPAAFTASGTTAANEPVGTAGSATVPAGFDVDGFLRIAKLNFVRLQAANDTRNIEDLREFLTPELFAEIRLQFDERSDASQQTDVVTLEAELLAVETEGARHIASVRFAGMIRESAQGAAEPFAEIWNLIKPVDGNRGWQVAGIQQIT